AGAVLLAGEVDARIILVEADRDVGIRLVVAQADVEPGPVPLDEALLSQQRLGLGRRDQRLDSVNAGCHAGFPAGEVRGDAFADRARLADVEQLPVGSVEEVDARRVGQAATLLGNPLGTRLGTFSVRFGHRSKSRLPVPWPDRAAGRREGDQMSSQTVSPP